MARVLSGKRAARVGAVLLAVGATLALAIGTAFAAVPSQAVSPGQMLPKSDFVVSTGLDEIATQAGMKFGVSYTTPPVQVTAASNDGRQIQTYRWNGFSDYTNPLYAVDPSTGEWGWAGVQDSPVKSLCYQGEEVSTPELLTIAQATTTEGHVSLQQYGFGWMEMDAYCHTGITIVCPADAPTFDVTVTWPRVGLYKGEPCGMRWRITGTNYSNDTDRHTQFDNTVLQFGDLLYGGGYVFNARDVRIQAEILDLDGNVIPFDDLAFYYGSQNYYGDYDNESLLVKDSTTDSIWYAATTNMRSEAAQGAPGWTESYSTSNDFLDYLTNPPNEKFARNGTYVNVKAGNNFFFEIGYSSSHSRNASGNKFFSGWFQFSTQSVAAVDVEKPKKSVDKRVCDEGERLTYEVTQRVPSIAETTVPYSSAAFTDILDAGLAYNGDLKVYDTRGRDVTGTAGTVSVSGQTLRYTFKKSWLDGIGDTSSGTLDYNGGNLRFVFSANTRSGTAGKTIPNQAMTYFNNKAFNTDQVITIVLDKPSKAPATQTRELGATASFTVTEKIVQPMDDTSIKSVVMTDTLSPVFDVSDPSRVTCTVSKDGTDVTSGWDVSLSGRTITAKAKSMAAANFGGTFTFAITAPLKASYDLSTLDMTKHPGYATATNKASVNIVATDGNASYPKDTEDVDVLIPYWDVKVVKTSSPAGSTRPMDAARFAVKDPGGVTVASNIAPNGTARLYHAGTYTVTETVVPEGYGPADDEQVTLAASGSGQTATVNMVDPVLSYDPVKSPSEQVKELGETAQFKISQTVVYSSGGNVMTDTLADVFDASRATWSAKVGSTDVTDAWTMTRDGQKLTFTMRSPSSVDANGSPTVFTVNAPLKASYDLSTLDLQEREGYAHVTNKATFTVTGSGGWSESKDTNEVDVYIPYWKVRVVKQADDQGASGSLEGARFALANASGTAVLSDMRAGTEYAVNNSGSYVLSETVVPQGYEKAEPQSVSLSSANAGQTVIVTLVDDYLDYPPVKTPAEQTRSVGETATFEVSQVVKYNSASVVMTDELDACLDASRVTWSVKLGTTNITDAWTMTRDGQKLTFTMKPGSGRIGSPNKATVFTISTPVREDFDVSSMDLEKRPGYGHAVNEAKFTVKSTAGWTKELPTPPVDVYVPYWRVKLEKVSDDPSQVQGHPLDGARFSVYLGSVEKASNLKPGDELALYQAGTYTVKETVCPEGYDLASDSSFTLTADNMDAVVNVSLKDVFLVYTPTKSPATQTRKVGDTASFDISQTVKYSAASNVMTDTLSDVFDASRATWTARVGDADVTSCWRMERNGQKLTFTQVASPSSDIGITPTVFTVKAPVKMAYDLSQLDLDAHDGVATTYNDAEFTVKSSDGKTYTSKTNKVEVQIPYWRVKVVKTRDYEPQNKPYPIDSARFGLLKPDGSAYLSNVTSGEVHDVYLPGAYTVRETTVPVGYDAAPDSTVTFTPANTGQTVTVNVVDHFIAFGDAALTKTSTQQAWAMSLATYSLEGAVYDVYPSASDAAAGVNRVASMTTDAAGNAKVTKLESGNYVVVERTPSKGHNLDTKVRSVKVPENGGTISVGSVEPAPYCVRDVIAEKLDADIMQPGRMQGNAVLENAWFKVDFYDIEAMSGTPKATATFATAADGKAAFADATPVQGSWPYRVGGKNVIPLGWVKITEVASPEGYSVNPAPVYAKVAHEGEDAVWHLI